jgi:DNA-binding winged helix-turn-helix (wHTH) protein/tetratricopeptide (TPR) repeat protein
MEVILYRIGEFVLDPSSRELRHAGRLIDLPSSAFDCLVHLVANRHRPVGRDELIATVWGRAEVSETLLGHTIVRLRRELGDSGGDQHSIRTMPRVGYRWIAPTIEERLDAKAPRLGEAGAGSAPASLSVSPLAQAHAAIPPHAAEVPRAWPRVRLVGMLTFLVVLVALGVIFFGRRSPPVPGKKAHVDAPAVALVFPAAMAASSDSGWLRLGSMDLIADRLRRGSVATMESDAVVALLKDRPTDVETLLTDRSLAASASLRIAPHIAFENRSWRVRLDAVDGQRRLAVDAQDADPLVAARAATDLLLIKLGHAPPVDGRAASPAVEQLQQQIKSATLAGQLDLARTLIDDAPAALRETPELAWSSALVEATAGDYEGAHRSLDLLLERVSAEQDPALRARALNMRAAMFTRRGLAALAGADYAEAIGLVESHNEPLVLAHAYTGRGLVAAMSGKYDEAIADLGRARVISESAGGALGIAQIDLNLGLIAKIRGQFSLAQSLLTESVDRFEKLASQEEWAVAIEALAGMQMLTLDFIEALATTDRFWPPERHVGNVRLRWSLTITRAWALARLGRLDEAAALGKQVRAVATRPEDVASVASVDVLLAYVSLSRGDSDAAAATAAKAVISALENTDRDAYRDARLLHMDALEESGRAVEAAAEATELRKWLAKLPNGEGDVYVAFVDAEKARVEGDTNSALRSYSTALERASRLGIPDLLVICAVPYARLLEQVGQLQEASAVTGRISQWGDRDLRVALAEADLYRALGQTKAWREASERARSLAGQRATTVANAGQR